MKFLEPKAPTSKKFYMIDYSKLLQGDPIKQLTAVVTTGTIVLSKKVFNNNYVGFFLDDGVADEDTLITITMKTAAGQEYTDTATVYIIADEADIDFSIVLKQDIVEFAYQDLRLSGYIFDHTADELSAMLKRLDALMREYRLKGFDTGYNHPLNIGQSNLNDIAGVPDGLALSLGTLVAESFMDGIGKTYTPSFIKKARQAKDFVYAYCKTLPIRTIPTSYARGSGVKYFSITFPFFFRQSNTAKGNLLAGLAGQYIGSSLWDSAVWNQDAWV